MARKSDFISLARTKVKLLLDTLDAINDLNREYVAMGGSSWLVQGDFVGTNADILKADFDTAFGNAATLDGYVTTQNYDDTWYKIF
jgi:hypothetical protein